jgi:hypothetical protein
MTGSAVPAAIPALAAAIQAVLGTPSATIPTVGVGGLPKLGDHEVFVLGDVTDWRQEWGVTPTGSPLSGIRDETFLLTVRIYRKRIGGSLLELLADVAADRLAVEAACRADLTLGGSLSASGTCAVESASQSEGLADERTRELGLSVFVRCNAVIT